MWYPPSLSSLPFAFCLRGLQAWFDNPQNSTGRLTSRLSEEASLIKATTGEKLALSSQSICSLIAGLVIAFTASWRVALLVLAVFPLIACECHATCGHCDVPVAPS